MNIAQKVREEKEKHPERFCPRCLWRTQTRDGYKPCPKHPMPTPDLLAQIRAMAQMNRILAGEDEVLTQEAVECITKNLEEPDPTKRMGKDYFDRCLVSALISHERLRVERVLDNIAPIANS